MNIREETIKLLKKTKAPRNMKGYFYFIDAIELIHQNKTMDEIYNHIATKNLTTSESVRKSMSRFIQKISMMEKHVFNTSNKAFLIWFKNKLMDRII